MKAGRELDVLVAEKVMGYIMIDTEAMSPHNSSNGFTLDVILPLPDYSTDISAAWQVVEKFDYYTLSKIREGEDGSVSIVGFECRVTNFDHTTGLGISMESMSHAICLAALAAVEISLDIPAPVAP